MSLVIFSETFGSGEWPLVTEFRSKPGDVGCGGHGHGGIVFRWWGEPRAGLGLLGVVGRPHEFLPRGLACPISNAGGRRGSADHLPCASSWSNRLWGGGGMGGGGGRSEKSKPFRLQELPLTLVLGQREGASQTHPFPSDCRLVSFLPCNCASSFLPPHTLNCSEICPPSAPLSPPLHQA